MTDACVRLIENAYALDRGGPEWLAEFAEPMRSVHASAANAYLFEFERGPEGPTLVSVHAQDPADALHIRALFERAPASFMAMFATEPLLAMTASEVLATHGLRVEDTPLKASLPARLADLFALHSCDPVGGGLVVGVGLAEPVSLAARQRATWSQIAAHLAAGHRLRKRLAGRDPLPEAGAVLSTAGKLEHLGPGVDAGLVELFKQAVARVERARLRDTDAEQTLQLWQSLLAGEWSLADHYEANGRRFYVALRNPPEVARSKALTRREAEVVSYLARGTKTRAAAYALGVDEITVRGYLKTALAKLGLGSRAELIKLGAMLLSGGEIEPTP